MVLELVSYHQDETQSAGRALPDEMGWAWLAGLMGICQFHKARVRLVSDQRSCREKRKGGRKTMRATFRRLAVATVLAAAVTTAVLPGTAEARWGWRGGGWGWGWGGFGVGLGTGLLLAAATRPYYAGYYGYPY